MALPKAADANLSPSFKATAGAPKNPHGVDVAVAEAGALAWIAAMKKGDVICEKIEETAEDATGRSLFIVHRHRVK